MANIAAPGRPGRRDLIFFLVAVSLFLLPEVIIGFISSSQDSCMQPLADGAINTAADLLRCQEEHHSYTEEILHLIFYALGFTTFAYWVWERFSGIAENMSRIADNVNTSGENALGVAENIKNLLQNKGDFYFIGTAKQAHKKLTSLFETADTIYNMHVPYGTEMTFTLTDPDRVARIRKFVTRPGTKYIEIVGRDAFLKYGRDYQAMIGQELRREGSGLYVTDHIFPFLNFTILHTSRENGEVDKEVWFGWGGFSDYYSGEVFSTRAQDAIAMFFDLFNTVKDISNSPDDKRSLISRLQDYRGFWIDVARDKHSGNIENCAVLGFGFEASGTRRKKESRLCLKGAAFRVENGHPGSFVRVFTSQTCELRKTTVHVSHRAMVGKGDTVSVSSGQSTYDFSKVWLTGRMTGVVSSPEYEAASLYIETVAVRLPEDVQSQLEQLWPLDRDGAVVDFEKVREAIDSAMSALLAELSTAPVPQA